MTYKPNIFILRYSKSHLGSWKRMNIRCRDGECRVYVEKPENMSPAGAESTRDWWSRLRRIPNLPKGGQKDVLLTGNRRQWLKNW